MRKHLKFGLVAGVLAAPAAAAVIVPAPANAGGHSSSAYGISATGPVNVPATPSVTSAARPNSRSVASIPGNPLVKVSVLRARAVPGHAEASVVDLRVAATALGPDAVLSAKLIAATCDEGAGVSKLADVRLAGRPIEAGGSPNSTLTVPVAGLGGVQVTVDRQVRNPDGTLTVTGLHLDVRALGKSQTIDIASATCAPTGEAPKPTPIPSDLPVTG
ncbi:choice-of-anchor P family protein [Actinomadura sp. DC4]|uniref:choice-of-anchor P family protein n=1 Tax=Actinomadura sp. DC4 TaxID=3055069 RepID=UPI0025B00DAE|nr:choice-of-anchor P family protein [Actinomadura sp. DC4]MDN3352400.1 choice-of-anchor P family protein [Actinomadura sp. DC4]